jgi:hypothetical protein
MVSIKNRLKKLELSISDDSFFIQLAKIYCECEEIEFSAAEYSTVLTCLKWDDVFGNNQLIKDCK